MEPYPPPVEHERTTARSADADAPAGWRPPSRPPDAPPGLVVALQEEVT